MGVLDVVSVVLVGVGVDVVVVGWVFLAAVLLCRRCRRKGSGVTVVVGGGGASDEDGQGLAGTLWNCWCWRGG